MSAQSVADAKQNYPHLAELTTMFYEQDWADNVDGSEHMLVIEIVGNMFRQSIDEWLADAAESAAVQAEIDRVLAATDSPQACEQALGMEQDLYEHFGVNIRQVLENARSLLKHNGSLIY
jgi:hypothetical protein